MSTSLVTFQSLGISASSSTGPSSSRESTTQSRKSSSQSSSSTGWLSPIFGWSADYTESRRSSSGSSSSSSSGGDAVESGEERKARLKYAPGNFTEEKARQLRLMTTELEMSHEKMYHSAIASRLASDFSDRFSP